MFFSYYLLQHLYPFFLNEVINFEIIKSNLSWVKKYNLEQSNKISYVVGYNKA